MSDTNFQSIDETCRQRFESEWQGGRLSSIEQYLPEQDDPRYEPTLEELVHIDMEFSWKQAGGGDAAEIDSVTEPRRVEQYVEMFPPLGERSVLLRLVQQEFLLRHQFGDRPVADEYRARFPAVVTDNEAVETLVREQESSGAGTVRPLHPGQSLDRYRLMDVHGRGAFGNVWRAADAKLDRTIAVKELNVRVATAPQVRHRFEEEARIAAGLEHPGIVPVYDMGGLDGDHPYYTMKLVRGKTLAEEIVHCHAGDPGPARNVQKQKLLSSFLSVCHTMEYAHARGVVHRDLKPQNIVVGEFGETILLDWGLAKAPIGGSRPATGRSAVRESSDARETRAGQIKGTPAYMSPEQARGETGEVDEQSDVYALGAVLHQVLTGELPVAGNTPEEILENVRAGKVARPRATDRTIARPLESICLTALSCDKRDRYASVADLTTDLEHWLADEPVSTHRESVIAKCMRWTRRHRTLVTGVAATIIVALAGLMVTVLLLTNAWQRERVARQTADQQRVRAENNLEVALQSVDTFLVRFTDDERLRALGMQQLRQEMLQEAEQFYDQLAVQEGDDQNLVLQTTHALSQSARISSELGNIEQGIEKLDAALANVRDLLVAHPDNAVIQMEQAHLENEMGNLYERTGELSKAVEFQRGAMTKFGQLLEGDQRAEALQGMHTTQGNMAVALENRGEYRKAEKHYRDVISQFEKLVEEHPDDADAQRLLATTFSNLGVLLIKITPPAELDAVVDIYQRAIEHSRKAVELRSGDPDSRAHLAMLHVNMGIAWRRLMAVDPANLTKSADSYADALEIQQEVVRQRPEVMDHHHKLASTHGNLATVHYMRSDMAEAEKSIRRSIELRNRAPLGGTTVPLYQYALAGDYFTLKNALFGQQRIADAREALTAAAEIMEPLIALFPENVPFGFLLAKIYYAQGRACMFEDQYPEAVAWFDRAVPLMEKILDRTPNDVQVKLVRQHTFELRGESRIRSGQFQSGSADWDTTLQIARPQDVGRLRFGRASVNLQVGRYERAAELADEMLGLARQGDSERASLAFSAIRIYVLAAESATDDDALAADQRTVRSGELMQQAMDVLRSMAAEGALGSPSIREYLSTSPEMKLLREHPEFSTLIDRGPHDDQ